MLGRKYSATIKLVAGLSFIVVLSRCSPGASQTEGYETTPVSVPPAPSPVPVVREPPEEQPEAAEPATEEETATPRARQKKQTTPPNAAALSVLVNASFEQWDNGLPVGWRGSFPEETEARAQVLTPLKDAHDGNVALRLRTGGERRIIWQPVNIPLEDFGKGITCEAFAKNPVPEALFFRLTYTVNGEEVMKEAERQEGGEWTRFYITTQLPKEADPKSVKITFILRHFVSGAAILDGVSVKTGE